MHDIGKVAIPDRALLKPGKLTSEEFDIMKTHTTLGAQTLRAVQERFPDNELISMGIEAAQWHHERWDGTGYPDGLPEDEFRFVPESSRLRIVTTHCAPGAAINRRFRTMRRSPLSSKAAAPISILRS